MRRSGAAWLGVVAVLGGCTTLLGVDKDYHAVEPGECSSGELGCEGNAPRYCQDDGTWQVLAECMGQTCVGGACVGVCGPGQVQCDGSTPQQCDGSGHWESLAECVNQPCVGGSCVGACGPGQVQCSGNTPQQCDGDGLWESLAECVNQTCVGGACVGECAPGQVQCSGNTPQQCDGDGLWESLTACVDQTCVGGACVGECTVGNARCAGNMPQSCDGMGQWNDEASCAEPMPVCVAGACSAPPSCDGLGATCGPGGNEDCCARASMPGGTYNRTNNASYPATVSGFVLDRFEITVGRFRRFVAAYPAGKPAAGSGAHPLIAGSGWNAAWDVNLPADQAALIAAVKCSSTYQTWTDAPGGNENLPMNCITWYDAFAFCAWDGGRLPTEAEWNYAAAGGAEQRAYPWSVPPSSTTIDGTYAIYDCAGDGSAPGACAFSDIRLVGSRSPKGDGLWGQADLAGGLWEWNLDGYGSYQVPCNDCANVQSTSCRLFRGAAWDDSDTELLLSSRNCYTPTVRGNSGGGRCARTP